MVYGSTGSNELSTVSLDSLNKQSSQSSTLLSTNQQHDTAAAAEDAKVKARDTSYWTMPHKGQIFWLVICRVTEPLAYTTLSPYLYFMIRDFGYEDPATISLLGTLIMSSFALGQTISALFWGRFSDLRGRKPALLLGVFGTAISILIFGLSTNIYWAMGGRLMMGLLNGNIGVMRTMIAEIIGDRKEYQTRAFAILPITFNIGAIIGPMIGGLLANPVDHFPSLFGNSEFFKKYPYLLPNLFPFPMMVIAIFTTALFVEETAISNGLWLPKHSDPFLKLGRWLQGKKDDKNKYTLIKQQEEEEESDDENENDGQEGELPAVSSLPEYESDNENHMEEGTASQGRPIQPSDGFKKILTWPVKITLISYVILMMHLPTFSQLFPLFFSTPRLGPEYHTNPFTFNGGLGLQSSQIGLILSIHGALAISLQLLAYPALAAYMGNANLHKLSTLFFPLCFFLIPYLSFMPESSMEMAAATVSSGLVIVAQTFAIPPMIVLVTNAAPSRQVLGTVHGLTHSVTSGAKFVGPFILGNIYSFGVRWNIIALAWWILSVVSVLGCIASFRLREWGEEDEDEEQSIDS